MARQTNYIVQPFVAGRGAGLKAAPAIPAKTADAAIRMAEKMAPSKLGVVAYSSSGDPDTGDYDEEPTILFKAGRLPPQFEG
jgi:hypothetical protein